MKSVATFRNISLLCHGYASGGGRIIS